MKVDQYPLPTVQDLFATLSNGKKFTKLDLTQAYHQLSMEEDSKPYVTISTHIGLFHYNRMPYGIASGPAIFQKNMEEILSGIEGVQVFIDDIRLTGDSDEQHLERLDKVLEALENNGVKLNKDKCSFMQKAINYLGHTIDADGLHPQEDKVKAMQNVSRPENVKELRSFLGGVQYYGKFLPNLSATLKSLNDLLKKDQEWKWTEECEASFQKVKDMLGSKTVLTHYNPSLPVLLATDASTKGLGVVLSHRMPNGEERPIAYASRSLKKAETNYAQIEKEALGIMFGIRKFHQYVYGRCFTLITDHKPLLKILGPKNNLPSMAAARIQRWYVELCAYQYDIQYKRSEDHSNADMLSRLPEAQQQQQYPKQETVYFSYINEMPVSAADIAAETKKDPTLARVLQFTQNGWPSYVDEENLKSYFQRKEELTVESGVLQWGLRVIIPQKFRQRMLKELHKNHQGMNKTKAIARSYVYWLNLDRDIETMVNECEACAKVKNNPIAAPAFVWTFPSNPWERIHIDFAEYQGLKYLLLIDAFSKWPEIIPMKTTTAEKTDVLRQIFAIHGLPTTLVSDNGPPFTSCEFENFLTTNGIKHITSQPYQPSTNGSAERLVQTFKQMLKAVNPGRTGPQKLAKILLQLRTTPHAMTGESPAELLFKRKLKIRLDLIKPGFTTDMPNKQERQMQTQKSLRSFQPGDKVAVRNYRQGLSKWSFGTVLQILGPVSYLVRMGANYMRHCHINQMQAAPSSSSEDDQLAEDEILPAEMLGSSVQNASPESPQTASPRPTQRASPRSTQTVSPRSTQAASPCSSQNASPGSTQRDVTQCPTMNYGRYPKRIQRPLERMDL
ncbi:hypothetical protein RRG08_013764 [Elysia crispata]|nr:hypothetical protein RRG08_013764 [Elysia crispata]